MTSHNALSLPKNYNYSSEKLSIIYLNLNYFLFLTFSNSYNIIISDATTSNLLYNSILSLVYFNVVFKSVNLSLLLFFLKNPTV